MATEATNTSSIPPSSSHSRSWDSASIQEKKASRRGVGRGVVVVHAAACVWENRIVNGKKCAIHNLYNAHFKNLYVRLGINTFKVC